MPVAATRRHAGVQTGVGIAVVGIVTVFDISMHKAVAATRHNAVGQAAIGIALVAIIAGFDTDVYKAIAAACWNAAGWAVVGIAVVAIITFLTRFNNTVAASRRWGCARVRDLRGRGRGRTAGCHGQSEQYVDLWGHGKLLRSRGEVAPIVVGCATLLREL
jgi:hypothetical protein